MRELSRQLNTSGGIALAHHYSITSGSQDAEPSTRPEPTSKLILCTVGVPGSSHLRNLRVHFLSSTTPAVLPIAKVYPSLPPTLTRAQRLVQPTYPFSALTPVIVAVDETRRLTSHLTVACRHARLHRLRGMGDFVSAWQAAPLLHRPQ